MKNINKILKFSDEHLKSEMKRIVDKCEGKSVFVMPPKKGMPDQAQYLYDCQNELGIRYRDRL